MKKWTLLSFLSLILFVTAGPLRAESSAPKGSCACEEHCAQSKACSKHKHKHCACSDECKKDKACAAQQHKDCHCS